jgi:hypothetical protein
MDETTLYKTSAIAAITEIPSMSIYHYTRDFAEFFSPLASQHKRGRRWTDIDANMLMSIRSLYHKRLGKAAIREALTSGWRIGQQPMDSEAAAEVINTLLFVANRFKEEAQENKNQAQVYMNKLNQYAQRMEKDHQDLVNMKKALQNQAEAINILTTRKHGIFG